MRARRSAQAALGNAKEKAGTLQESVTSLTAEQTTCSRGRGRGRGRGRRHGRGRGKNTPATTRDGKKIRGGGRGITKQKLGRHSNISLPIKEASADENDSLRLQSSPENIVVDCNGPRNNNGKEEEKVEDKLKPSCIPLVRSSTTVSPSNDKVVPLDQHVSTGSRSTSDVRGGDASTSELVDSYAATALGVGQANDNTVVHTHNVPSHVCDEPTRVVPQSKPQKQREIDDKEEVEESRAEDSFCGNSGGEGGPTRNVTTIGIDTPIDGERKFLSQKLFVIDEKQSKVVEKEELVSMRDENKCSMQTDVIIINSEVDDKTNLCSQEKSDCSTTATSPSVEELKLKESNNSCKRLKRTLQASQDALGPTSHELKGSEDNTAILRDSKCVQPSPVHGDDVSDRTNDDAVLLNGQCEREDDSTTAITNTSARISKLDGKHELCTTRKQQPLSNDTKVIPTRVLRRKGDNTNKRQRGEVEISSSLTVDSLPVKMDFQEETNINEEERRQQQQLEIKDTEVGRVEVQTDEDVTEISNLLPKPNLNERFNDNRNNDASTNVSPSINTTKTYYSSQLDTEETCKDGQKKMDSIKNMPAQEKVASHSICTSAASVTNLTKEDSSTIPLTIRKKKRTSRELSSMFTCGGGGGSAAATISNQAASGLAPSLPTVTPNVHSTTPRVRPITQSWNSNRSRNWSQQQQHQQPQLYQQNPSNYMTTKESPNRCISYGGGSSSGGGVRRLYGTPSMHFQHQKQHRKDSYQDSDQAQKEVNESRANILQMLEEKVRIAGENIKKFRKSHLERTSRCAALKRIIKCIGGGMSGAQTLQSALLLTTDWHQEFDAATTDSMATCNTSMLLSEMPKGREKPLSWWGVQEVEAAVGNSSSGGRQNSDNNIPRENKLVKNW